MACFPHIESEQNLFFLGAYFGIVNCILPFLTIYNKYLIIPICNMAYLIMGNLVSYANLFIKNTL